MAKKKPIEVPSVHADAAVVGLSTKREKLAADLRLTNERLGYLEGELAVLPDEVELEARRLVGETVPDDSERRAALRTERDATAKSAAALGRALDMVEQSLSAAKTAARERITSAFNREHARPAGELVRTSLGALLEAFGTIQTVSDAARAAGIVPPISELELQACALHLDDVAAVFGGISR